METGKDKRGNYIAGIVTQFEERLDRVTFGSGKEFRCVGVRDLPKEQINKIKVGEYITAYFLGNSQYFIGYILDKKEKKMETTEKVVYFNTEGLTEEQKKELKKDFTNNLEVAARIFAVTASYEETKQDIAESTLKVAEVAAALTIIVDANTTKILKELK